MSEEKIHLEMSRYCVPFTPFQKKLEEATVCIVSTAAVYHQDSPPFKVDGDESFREIPGSAPGSELRYADEHFDHACADKDINCIFPIDRILELGHEQRIAGPATKHFSMGFTQQLRKIRDTTVPRIATEVDKVRPDAVLLTGG